MDNPLDNTPNQSPALTQDQVNALLQSLQSSQQSQPPAQGQSSSVDPSQLFHVAAQLTMQAHGAQPQGDQSSSNISAIAPRIQGGPNFWGRLGSAMLGHPVSQFAAPVTATNSIPDQSSLPDNMKLPPIGTDANGKPLYDMAAAQKQQGYEAQLASMLAKQSNSNPSFNKSQLMANGISEDDADKLIASNSGNPVGMKQLADYRAGQKNTTTQVMADARKKMADVAQQRIVAMTQGPDDLQPGMKDASQRVNNILRFNGIYKQIQDQGFTATKLQRSLMNTETARVIAGSGGVVTDDGFNRIASETAASKVTDWQQWLLNEATPAQFRSFAQQSKQLMDNEFTINQQIFQAGQQMSAKILHAATPVPYQPPASISGVSMPTSPNPSSALQPPVTGQASGQGKPDPATRFNQLMKSGLNKKQAYALMHQEGY